MNRRLKRALWMALALVLLGGVCVTAALALADFKWENFNTDEPRVQADYQFDPAEVKAIDIRSAGDNVRIQQGGDSVSVNCWNGENDRYEVKVVDGVLTVSYHSDARAWFGIHFGQGHELTVALPESINLESVQASVDAYDIHVSEVQAPSMEISSISGDIRLQGVQTEGEIIADSKSGNIHVEGVEVGGIATFDTLSGNLTVREARFAEALSISAVSGDVRLENIECTGNAALGTLSGNVRIIDVGVNGALEVSASSGNVYFKGLNPGSDVRIDTLSGDVSGEIPDNVPMIFNAETASGNVNLPSSQPGDQTFDVSTASGNISVKYAE